MGPEESWQVVTAQRLAVADIMESVEPARWEAPSLCAEWRVRDVVAHLVLGSQRPAVGGLLREAWRARGDFHRMNRDMAVAYAQRPTRVLTDELRQRAASRDIPSVTNYRNILFDVLVHAQDITVPLGRPLEMPRPAAVAGATTVWNTRWPLWTRRRFRGLRFVAEDAPWTVGAGREVRGPVAALLLTLTGRGVALQQLTGDGVLDLATRLPSRRHLGQADPPKESPQTSETPC
jgi:uncharacterized protein (TIGR03083 family)